MQRVLESTLLLAVVGNVAAIAYQVALQPLLVRRVRKKKVLEGCEVDETKTSFEGAKNRTTCPCRWCKKASESGDGTALSADLLESHTQETIQEAYEAEHVPIFYPSESEPVEVEPLRSIHDEDGPSEGPEVDTFHVDDDEITRCADVCEESLPLSSPCFVEQVETSTVDPARVEEFWNFCHAASQAASQEHAANHPGLEMGADRTERGSDACKEAELSEIPACCADPCATTEIPLAEEIPASGITCGLTMKEARSQENLRYSQEEDADDSLEDFNEEQCGLQPASPQATGRRTWAVYRSDSSLATKLPLTDFRFNRGTEVPLIEAEDTDLTEWTKCLADDSVASNQKSMDEKFGPEPSPSPIAPKTPSLDWTVKLLQRETIQSFKKNLVLRGSPAQRVMGGQDSDMSQSEEVMLETKDAFLLDESVLVEVRRSA